MPTVSHEGLLALFRNRPMLAPELLRDTLGMELPEFSSVELSAAELTQIVPTEYRADLVLLLRDGEPVFGVIVEVQLGRDDRKHYSWPLYVAALRARWECPVSLLVVTPENTVVRWARRSIDLGHPGFSFRPVIAGPDVVPWITDPDEARADPELAVLSALAHRDSDGGLEVVLAALAATAGLDDERATLYHDLIDVGLSEAARGALQELMMDGKYEYQSEFVKKHYGLGLAAGQAKGKAEALVSLLEARGLSLDAVQLATIEACQDSDRLQRWIVAGVTAASVAEVLAVE